jgi:hypoxanthine phosphoribosyltransferase
VSLPTDVVFSAAQIAERVGQLARQIDADYGSAPRRSPLVLVCVLKGSFIFAADLARALRLPVRVEFLGVKSYGDSTRSSGVVQLTQDLAAPIAGQDVLVVEDIVDTGLTCHYLLEQLKTRGPASIKLCALLHKPSRSVQPVAIDYLGFTIPDVFVVGYGLDHAEQHRHLPDICSLSSE